MAPYRAPVSGLGLFEPWVLPSKWGGAGNSALVLTEHAHMYYQRHTTCTNDIKNNQDHFKAIRTNSHKRLQHKFRREGRHSSFLQRSKHATWSNKWSYRLNNNNHMHHLLRKFNLDTYLHSQKQAQSNIQNTHITSYCRRLKTKTC